jgi:hypothetical protein
MALSRTIVETIHACVRFIDRFALCNKCLSIIEQFFLFIFLSASTCFFSVEIEEEWFLAFFLSTNKKYLLKKRQNERKSYTRSISLYVFFWKINQIEPVNWKKMLLLEATGWRFAKCSNNLISNNSIDLCVWVSNVWRFGPQNCFPFICAHLNLIGSYHSLLFLALFLSSPEILTSCLSLALWSENRHVRCESVSLLCWLCVTIHTIF